MCQFCAAGNLGKTRLLEVLFRKLFPNYVSKSSFIASNSKEQLASNSNGVNNEAIIQIWKKVISFIDKIEILKTSTGCVSFSEEMIE